MAASGSGGLRIDSVAERAGVNKRMIYVHFGSRDGLVQLVRRLQLGSLLADSGLSESSRLVLRELLGAVPSDAPAEFADQAARKLGVRITLSHLAELDAARWEHLTGRDVARLGQELMHLLQAGSAKPRFRLSSTTRYRREPAI